MEPSTNVDGDGHIESQWGEDVLLQWSRRRTSTETVVTDRVDVPAVLASMEPSTNVDGDASSTFVVLRGVSLQWSRRRTSTETSCALPSRRSISARFNGAVDERRRRPIRAKLVPAGIPSLQWSRRRTSTETLAQGLRWDLLIRVASMEPSTNVDGDREREQEDRSDRGASMEPSTNVDGDCRGGCSWCRPCCGFNGAVDERRRRLDAPEGPPSG